MSAAKDRGTRWESEIVAFLASEGFTYVERRALNGNRDRGDIAGIPGVVIEAKSQNRISLAEWVDETVAETANDGAWLGVTWAKRKGKSSAGDGYVILTGHQFAELLRIVTETKRPTTAAPPKRPDEALIGHMEGEREAHRLRKS